VELSAVFRQLIIALGLGLLVGLQRERVASRLAGVRTFPLVTLLGSFSALLARATDGWVLAAGFAALAAMIVVGNIAKLKEGPPDPGLTTEIALLLMFGVGAYLIFGYEEVAIATGGGAAVLLQAKSPLHGMVSKLGDQDVKAIMQFALISLVILPVLPDQTYGPYAVFNPRQAWLMVVLIVGINLAGYILYKFQGQKTGMLLAGLLGGLISSTATTVSYARRSAQAAGGPALAAIVIMMASAVVLPRVLLAVGVVAPGFFAVASPPILALFAILTAITAATWFWSRAKRDPMPPQENPTELRSALLFGLMFSVVLVAVAAAKEHLGSGGLYLVAALSGLTDVDAITLSTAQMVDSGRLAAADGWRMIVVAILSNLVFKLGIAAVLGDRPLLYRLIPYTLAAFAGAALLLALWP
jgi:uncharacterized membrane protein (DUF4010 family)